MAFHKQLLNIVAFASVLLLDHTTTVYACSCFLRSTHPCYWFQADKATDIVVRGTALSRTEQIDSDTSTYPLPTAIYTISVNTIYKGELDVTDEQEIEVTTGINDDMCGVELELGEEYLLGIYEGDLELSMSSCGLNMNWSNISDEDKASVEAGCDDDPCGFACNDSQECLQYERNEKWYCSDTCDPSPCFGGEQCTTRARRWCRDSGAAGCPEKHTCR